MGDALEEAALDELRILRHLFVVEERGGRHARLLEALHQRRGIVLLGPGGQFRLDGVAVVVAGDDAGKALVGGQLRVAHLLAERCEDGVGGNGDRDPAIVGLLGETGRPHRGAGEDPIGRHRRMAVAGVAVHAAVHRVVHERVAQVLADGLGLRDLDQLALARAPPCPERGLEREGDVRAGVRVAVQGGRGERRVGVLVAAQRGVADDGLHDVAVALVVGVRAADPEAREAHHDQPRVDLRQRRPVDLEVPDDVGRVVLDEGVGLADEVVEELAAALAGEVERDRLAGALGVVEPRLTVPEALAGVAVDVVAAGRARQQRRVEVALHRAGGVEVLDRLDLDHLGAEVGEDQRRVGTRPNDRLREDAHPLEGKAALGDRGFAHRRLR